MIINHTSNSIALIPCSKLKKKWIYRAYELYSPSKMFQWYVKYAKMYCKDWYILSAKHWLIDKNKLLQNYDFTLKYAKDEEVKKYCEIISKQIIDTIPDDIELIIFAWEKYTKYLNVPHKIIKPLYKKKQGVRLSYLTKL